MQIAFEVVIPICSFLTILTQDKVDEAVKLLLSLKAEYKEKIGQDYKPGQPASAQTSDLKHPKSTETSSPGSPEAQVLFNQVALQGEEVRKLKSEKAEKVILLINSFIYLKRAWNKYCTHFYSLLPSYSLKIS